MSGCLLINLGLIAARAPLLCTCVNKKEMAEAEGVDDQNQDGGHTATTLMAPD